MYFCLHLLLLASLACCILFRVYQFKCTREYHRQSPCFGGLRTLADLQLLRNVKFTITFVVYAVVTEVKLLLAQ